jgi:hypothetical protein
VIEITDRVVEIRYKHSKCYLGGGLTMSMRSALWLPAFFLALALLILVVSLGAIFAFAYRNRRPSFSYFASGPPPLSEIRQY